MVVRWQPQAYSHQLNDSHRESMVAYSFSQTPWDGSDWPHLDPMLTPKQTTLAKGMQYFLCSGLGHVFSGTRECQFHLIHRD